MTSHSQPVGAPELKPCPFCGSSDVTKNSRVGMGSSTISFISCRACHAEGPYSTKVENHVAAWNTRTALVDSMPQGIAEDYADSEKLIMEEGMAMHPYALAARHILHCLESTTQRLALMESQVPKWHAIEIAPKDNMLILGFGNAPNIKDCSFVMYWSQTFKEWQISFGKKAEPTHWMPLPESPSKDK